VSDTGGDPACWAHLGGEDSVTSFESFHDEEGSGVVWSLPHGGGLDANIVRLAARDTIGEHVNDQLDVLVVVWSGSGELVVDDRRVPLRPGTIAHVDRGARRSICAEGEGLVYLSAHPSRGPMTISRPD
jgi:quercetin dioxygenase-like cupin family protein